MAKFLNKRDRNNIRRTAYELYVYDWYYQHGITVEQLIEKRLEYAEENIYGSRGFFEWLCDTGGFSGECYVSFGEFVSNEYRERHRIHLLLGSIKSLTDLYELDIEAAEAEERGTALVLDYWFSRGTRKSDTQYETLYASDDGRCYVDMEPGAEVPVLYEKKERLRSAEGNKYPGLEDADVIIFCPERK